MKTTRTLLVLILLCIILYSCKKEDAPSNGGKPSTEENVILSLVNNVRQSGCTCGATVMPPVPPVTWNDLLEQAALGHSIDMNNMKKMSHTGSDGSSASTRVTRTGYTWKYVAENIAVGYPSEQAVMNGWLQSEGHCKNIMSANVKEMGVARDGNYWTQVFGAR